MTYNVVHWIKSKKVFLLNHVLDDSVWKGDIIHLLKRPIRYLVIVKLLLIFLLMHHISVAELQVVEIS